MSCHYTKPKCGKYLTFNEAIPNGVNFNPSPQTKICCNITTNINTPSFSELLMTGKLDVTAVLEPKPKIN